MFGEITCLGSVMGVVESQGRITLSQCDLICVALHELLVLDSVSGWLVSKSIATLIGQEVSHSFSIDLGTIQSLSLWQCSLIVSIKVLVWHEYGIGVNGDG